MRKFPYIFILAAIISAGIAAFALANDNGQNIAANDPAYASDPIEVLTQNKNFINSRLDVKELKEQVKIKQEEAINIAKNLVGSDADLEASKVTAVKALFTDNENTRLIEKNIVLKDYPVWIVTFHGVKLVKRSAPQGYAGDTEVIADKNIIIDALTGEILESVSYSN